MEADEALVMHLDEIALPDGVTLGTISASATIQDDDTLTASVADVAVSESAGIAWLTVTLSHAPEREVTLSYAASDGTATAGSDYTAATGTLTIPAGSAAWLVRVAVTDDAVDEPDETFTVTLSDPQPSDQVTLSDSSATVTITDDEETPTLSLDPASNLLVEGGATTVACDSERGLERGGRSDGLRRRGGAGRGRRLQPDGDDAHDRGGRDDQHRDGSADGRG